MVMVVVLVVALALTVYGALHDRALNRRRAAEMLGPPARDIPNLPSDAPSPAYVTEAQARRRPETARDTLGERDRDAEGTVEVAAGHASADFATDTRTGTAVLDAPLVLVCEGGVGTIRELLPALEHAIRASRPLVVVAPSIAPDVLGTLEVNAIQGLVPGVAVLADDAVRAEIASLSRAVPVDATDRRSGWTDPAAFGRLARWTSTRTSSRLTPAASLSSAEVAE
ncbi:hypothetical protein SAMN04488544_3046 [Microlunatus sagamiharensis]|uniref:Uncharacterized protein n=1 Tax=Microlunatus sagamiharensis TaxID=546874 RepID=A0A1H2N1U4_9ACTN|nr:hypothetical protein SAMN04488544_3046 [Microlunatus sagamiharensis]